MSKRATLEALLARVLEGDGPDRELDGEIACAVNGFTMHEDSNPADGHFAFWYGKPWESVCSNCSNWPPYTASLDAVLRDLLPEGWSLELYSEGAALLWKQPPEPAIRHTITAPRCATPLRALIAACLKARMEAQSE